MKKKTFLEPVKETAQTLATTVIETKPPATVVASTVKPEIKPSKTVVKATEKPQVISSVVQVLAGPAQNAITPNVQIVSSHVEVRGGDNTKQVNSPQSPLVKKDVSIAVQTQVNVGSTKIVEGEPILYSSIVAVQSSSDNNDNEEESNEEEAEHQEGEDDEPVIQIGNNIGEPEYDFLSRQPAEYVEETYRVKNLRPQASSSSGKFSHKTRQTAEARKLQQNNSKNDDSHPTGLVTKLGGTVVKDGVTTVHETSVIGTYISGKYAQVLQSTSQIFNGKAKVKPTPASQLRILKTAPPSIPKGNRNHNLEPTPVSSNEETAALPIDALYAGNAQSPNLVRASRRPATSSGNFKNRFRTRNKDESDQQESPEESVTQQNQHTSTSKKSSRNRTTKPKG